MSLTDDICQLPMEDQSYIEGCVGVYLPVNSWWVCGVRAEIGPADCGCRGCCPPPTPPELPSKNYGKSKQIVLWDCVGLIYSDAYKSLAKPSLKLVQLRQLHDANSNRPLHSLRLSPVSGLSRAESQVQDALS